MSLSVNEIKKELLFILQNWNHILPAESQLCRFEIVNRGNPISVQQRIKEIILEVIEFLQEEQDPRLSQIIRMRYFQDLSSRTIAMQLNISEPHFFRLQGRALEKSAQLIWELENDAHQMKIRALLANLALEHSKLIGRDAEIAQLVSLLISPQPPMAIGIEGMGGIGKTALASAVARKVIESGDFDGVAWITARQQPLSMGGRINSSQVTKDADFFISSLIGQLGQEDPLILSLDSNRATQWLQQYLRENRCLIVLDNLETVTELESILRMIEQLSGTTKFLLTSRIHLEGAHNIYHVSVSELSEDQSLELIRREAMMQNMLGIFSTSDEDLRPIYRTVGGNPLALKLVVGLLFSQPLDAVLDDLTSQNYTMSKDLYNYIYLQSWNALSEMEKGLLLALPLVETEGATQDEIAEVSGSAIEDVRAALLTLVRLNLVNVHGNLKSRRYTIHPLTRAFLGKEIAISIEES